MKKNKILDTNVLLRFLVGDNKKQKKLAEEEFKKAQEGKINITVYPLVIAETCFVLESFYKAEREDIAEKLQVFLSQRWLKVENREIMLYLWQSYVDSLHFVDSFLHAWAEINKGEILTFGQELKS